MSENLQWKYQNNKIVSDGYIRAEITQEDCPIDTKEYYVATVPEGAIVLGMIAVIDGYEVLAGGFELKVDIGMNDCQFCMNNVIQFAAGESSKCTEDCKCEVTDQDYLVRITLKDDLPEGRILLLIHVILPELVICEAEPVDLCYETTIVDPCTGGCSCTVDTCGPVGLQVVAETTPATAAAGDEVTSKVTITNTGTLAATDVIAMIELPAGYEANTEAYNTSTGIYIPATNMFTIPRLAVGETAVLTITGKLEDDVVLTTTRPVALNQENTANVASDVYTDTTTKT